MDYFELLTQCGLSKKESATYLTLLEQGPLSISKIGHHTHINRPALYSLLPSLEEKGIVSSIQNGKRTQYVAEPPEKVEQLFTEKQKEIGSQLESFKKRYKSKKTEQPTVKFFKGDRGIVFVYDDIVATVPRGGSFYRYTALIDPVPERFKSTRYHSIRETKNIERYAITSSKKALGKVSKLNRHVRAIPADFDLFEDNVSLLLYGDKVAYVDYENENTFIIESPKIAKFQKKLYKLLWKKLT